MNRTIAVLAVLALGLNSAMAQDVAPAAPAAAPAAPAATDIVVDPAAAIPTAPKQANLLTGFYATLAVIDICAIPVADDVKAGMAGDQKRLEASVGLDEASAAKAYAEVKTDVEKTTPDCAEGSADRASVDAVTGIYAAAAGGAPVATEAPLTAPVPATPTR